MSQKYNTNYDDWSILDFGCDVEFVQAFKKLEDAHGFCHGVDVLKPIINFFK
ncbi:hypothetical protein SynROS8604_00227 [Synechococcus sp. ROS8604]|nr:hypothetical protein SynROS8604_00227 [Synechococcus sp. ROS8604]